MNVLYIRGWWSKIKYTLLLFRYRRRLKAAANETQEQLETLTYRYALEICQILNIKDMRTRSKVFLDLVLH